MMMRVTKQFEHLEIQLEAIKSATNYFASDNCIGRGGFGEVYKGELLHSKGQTMVALKRLNRAFGQGDPEFWKEIIMLSLYKHDNIVSLLGYCDESGEKILVYEYASKRSLDLYLNNDDLTWIQRLNICIGAARGLAYLHNPGDTQQRVLHRDIKSSNILLDQNWNPKISDMGLSKFGPANQQFTFLVSNAVGTIGYCDPLYVETGLLTKESDVYSFGVVLFEVLCGRLCIGNNNDKRRPLTGLARQCYEKNKVNEIIHGSIRDEINSNSLEAFTTIAYQCLKRDLEERPSMIEVVKRLENALQHQMVDEGERLAKVMPAKLTSTTKRDIEERPSIIEVMKRLENALQHQDGDVNKIKIQSLKLEDGDNDEQQEAREDIEKYINVGEGTSTSAFMSSKYGSDGQELVNDEEYQNKGEYYTNNEKAAAPHILINGYKNVLSLAIATEYSFKHAEEIKNYLKGPKQNLKMQRPLQENGVLERTKIFKIASIRR